MKKIFFVILTIILLEFLGSPALAIAPNYCEDEESPCTRILKYNKDGTAISSTCTKTGENLYYCECQGSNPVKECHIGKIITDPICACCGDCTIYNALEIGTNIAKIILKYLGVTTLIFFIIGGIIWLTSGGSQAQIERGKKIIVGALVGLIVVLGAYLIIQTILKWVAPHYKLSDNSSFRIENNYNLLATNKFNEYINKFYEKIL